MQTGLKAWRINPNDCKITLIYHDHEPIITSFDCNSNFHLVEGMTVEETMILLNERYKEIKVQNEKIELQNKENEEYVNELLKDNRFELKNGCVYRVGIPISIPDNLVRELANPDNREKLHNFWLWTSLIRKPESRESFYGYCKANDLVITKEGFVVGFRRAWKKGENSELKEFVNLHYARLRNAKKSTNVQVFEEDGEYSLNWKSSLNVVGVLKDLYHNQTEGVRYESQYIGPNGKRTVYRIGEETRMNESDADFSREECSRGLHLSSGGYDFSGYGDAPLAVVFNPCDVAFAPYSDHQKIRVLALTPLCELKEDCAFELTPEHEEIIADLMTTHLERLEEQLSNCNFEEYEEHSVFQNKLQLVQMLTTITSADKEVLGNRYLKL